MAELENKHASLPRNMAQMHPFIAIRYLGLVFLQLGMAGLAPAYVALHFIIVGAARTLFVIRNVQAVGEEGCGPRRERMKKKNNLQRSTDG